MGTDRKGCWMGCKEAEGTSISIWRGIQSIWGGFPCPKAVGPCIYKAKPHINVENFGQNFGAAKNISDKPDLTGFSTNPSPNPKGLHPKSPWIRTFKLRMGSWSGLPISGKGDTWRELYSSSLSVPFYHTFYHFPLFTPRFQSPFEKFLLSIFVTCYRSWRGTRTWVAYVDSENLF